VDANAYEVKLFHYSCYAIVLRLAYLGVLLLIRIRLLS
jgi:hypothetical protein